jgi:hypothetical protein
MALEGTLDNTQKVVYTANPTTAGGRPAALDPTSSLSATVVSGDGTVGTSTANTVELISGDAEGDTTFTVSGDAKQGSDVELISETVVLHVTAAQASNMGGSLGAPVPK